MDFGSLEKPLKILTFDGGGLQAISTLLILDTLLNTIQQANKAKIKPRPCDVFDVIAGIGAGGWLALLLGRFRLDIKTCLTEWYKLLQCIAPRSRGQGIRRRVFAHSYFDDTLLIKQVNRLTRLYGTGETLIDPYPSDARCKFVFVAAAQKVNRLHTSSSSSEVYNLFRTYPVGENAKLRAGPQDPGSISIASAFGATGAARYFSAPWKEHIVAEGKTSFLDSGFKKAHNITLLALEEMWGIYGESCPISVIVNIGPGIPTEADFSKIARRFSWGRKKHTDNSPEYYKTRYSAESDSSPLKLPQGRRNQRFRDEESALENRIHDELRKRYGEEDAPPYYRLSLDITPQGTVQNDTRKPGAILDATSAYLESPKVGTSMTRISQVV